MWGFEQMVNILVHRLLDIYSISSCGNKDDYEDQFDAGLFPDNFPCGSSYNQLRAGHSHIAGKLCYQLLLHIIQFVNRVILRNIFNLVRIMFKFILVSAFERHSLELV